MDFLYDWVVSTLGFVEGLQAWRTPLLNAWPVELAASQSGLLFGALVGLDAERRRVRFAVAGSWQQKTGRYLLGLMFLLLAWAGLRAVFGLMEGGHLVESVLRIVRYAVVGLTVTWWGPVLFVRLGLAHKE